jgi:hypothetical protein
MISPQSSPAAKSFAHILAYPADKPRFDQARESLRARSLRAPNQAEVTHEMLDVWETLEPVRALFSTEEGRQITMPEAVKYLIEHWETT